MRLTTLLLALAVACGAHAYEFYGTLVNGKGKPQKGVEVTIKGSNAKLLSDKHGQFMMPLTSVADTVVIIESPNKHIYYVPDSTNDVTFVLNKKSYDVIIGDSTETHEYVKIKSPRRRSNMLTHDDIMRRKPMDLYDLLRGSFPGVTVSRTDQGQMVNVRGINSINCNIEPLFIIDGIEFSTSAGANSAAIIEQIATIELNSTGAGFGIKGANGVIIITTMGSTVQTPIRAGVAE